jgi:hypothetical protein
MPRLRSLVFSFFGFELNKEVRGFFDFDLLELGWPGLSVELMLNTLAVSSMFGEFVACDLGCGRAAGVLVP